MTAYCDMKRLSKKLLGGDEVGYVCYWCPGCKSPHSIPVNPPAEHVGPRWSFDGNNEAPTFSPSVRHFHGGHSYTRDDGSTKHVPERTFCHYFIVAGKINYCGDCTHELNGQTGIDLPNFPAKLLRRKPCRS